MQTQLFQDRFGVMLYDDARNILEQHRNPETEFMTSDDYMSTNGLCRKHRLQMNRR